MKRYIVTQGQSLMDIAIEVYGDITGIFQLIEDNADLATVQEGLEAGQSLRIDPSVDLSSSNTQLTTIEVELRTKKSYVVTSGQTLMDVAIEVYGDIAGIFQLIEDNATLQTVEDSLQAGQILKYDTTLAVNEEVAAYYASRKLKINTGEYEEAVEAEGLKSSEGTVLISIDEIILKAADQ